MKLNLACGTDIRNGWINLDVVHQWPGAPRACDVLWDARKDRIPFGDSVASEVYMGYTLLHLAPRFHEPLLRDVRRVLRSDGTLTVGEVDMDLVMCRWLADPTDTRCAELIWGEQANWVSGELIEGLEPFDKHCQGFTEASLRNLLEINGFEVMERIRIHCVEVWYELTLRCKKGSHA